MNTITTNSSLILLKNKYNYTNNCALIVFFLLISNIFAQETYPILPDNIPLTSQLVPMGWTLLHEASGDLNNDLVTDYCFVIEKTNPNATDIKDKHLRILGVYLANEDNSFDKALQSNTFIISKDKEEMYEPLERINISEDGFLELYFQIWYEETKWLISNYLYRFKLIKSEFKLVKVNQSDTNRDNGGVLEYLFDFEARRLYTNLNNFQTGKSKSEDKRIKVKGYKTLEELGKPLTWEVEGIKI